MTGWSAPSHWVIIALVVLVLFGYKKLPEMSRSVGRSLRIFKTEMKGMDQDDATRESADAETPAGNAHTPAITSPVVAPPVVTPPPSTPSAVAPVTPAVTPPTPAAEESSQQRTQA